MIRRRDFLRVGLGLAAGARTLLAHPGPSPKVKSVVWLWMDGGMSQAHTWDPQPKSTRKDCPMPIDTAVDGIQIAEGLPVCAAQMKHLSILRSLTHPYGDHAVAAYVMHAGVRWYPGEEAPAFGTLFSREAGRGDFPLPRYLALGPPERLPESPAFEEEHHPFRLRSLQNPIPGLHRNVDGARDRERAALLAEQNKEWSATRRQRLVNAHDWAFRKSEEIMNTPLLKAFNVHEEPEEVRGAYGTGFGEACLLARRLVEVGCPFVEVGMGGWSQPSGGVPYKTLVPSLDRGLGNLVKDLAANNRIRETLVVCATEFGKSPFTSQDEPLPNGFSVVLAGGTLAGGRVVGETGLENPKSPVTLQDYFATLFQASGLDPDQTYELNGRSMKYLERGRPVDSFF